MTGPAPRIPPNDLEAERDLLGAALLIPGEVLDLCGDIVQRDDFYSSSHADVWAAMLGLHHRGLGVDVTTLRGELLDAKKLTAIGGDDALLTLACRVPSVHLAEQHARRVAEMAARRRMITACTMAVSAAYDVAQSTDDVLDLAETSVLDAAQRRDSVGGPVHVQEGMRRLGESVADIAVNGPKMGITTGLGELDRRIGGMHPGHMIVLAGRPGMGKSAIAIGRAIHAAKTHEGAAVVFSLEMSGDDCFRRVASHEARVRGSAFRDGKFIHEETGRFLRELDALKRLPLYVDDTESITLSQIRSRCRRLRAKHGKISVVVVDYLQLMGTGHTSGRDNREAQVAALSRGLKSLAKHLACPVIALAQLNRDLEKRPNKRPQLSDLRESGAIEQDADVVIFAYRDEVYNPDTNDTGVIELIAAKVRHGVPGTVRAAWSGEYGRVTALERTYGAPSGREEDFQDD